MRKAWLVVWAAGAALLGSCSGSAERTCDFVGYRVYVQVQNARSHQVLCDAAVWSDNHPVRSKDCRYGIAFSAGTYWVQVSHPGFKTLVKSVEVPGDACGQPDSPDPVIVEIEPE